MTDFLAAYRDGAPDFVTSAVMDGIESYTDDLATRLRRAGAVFSVPALSAHTGPGLGNSVASMFKALVSRFEPKLNFSIATDLQAASDEVPALAVLKALGGAAAVPAETGASTASGITAVNTEAAELLMRISTVAAAAHTAAYASYESKQEALQTRGEILGVMSDVRHDAGEAEWINSYMAIGSLMSALNRDIDEELGRLPATVTVQPVSVRSSMALAHRLFGDTPSRVVEMAGDIVRRNAVLHPSFMPADNLEVLVDA